jgi:hypothetical protein
MNLNDYAENKVFDAILRGQALGAPATFYLALGTNLRSDAGAPAEPVGNGYARVAVTPSLTNFTSTQGNTATSTGTDGTGETAVEVLFPVSTGAWAGGVNIQSVWFMDAAAAGNCWISIDLTTPIAVTAAGFTLKFAAGQLSFQIDNG